MRSKVVISVLAFAGWGNGRWLAEGQTVSCPSTKQPLVWKIRQGNEIGYVVGSYNMTSDDLKLSTSSEFDALDPIVNQALECADIAYFQFGCDPADQSPASVGHYLAHCAYYPIVDEKDAIADRLSEVQMNNLKAGITAFVNSAPAKCRSAADGLLESAQGIVDNVSYRTTLLDLYHQSIEAINPLWCDSSDSQAQNYESLLRKQFGATKPIYGLEDIGVQCQVYQGNNVEQDQMLANIMATNFKNPAWSKNITTMLGSMEEVMQCGDLTKLAQLMEFLKDLPLAGERMLQSRSNDLTYGITQAFKTNPGRKLLFVVPVTHIIDAAGRQGVLTLLAEAGFTAERIGQGSSLQCQVSDFEAPGAMALGHCLKPPAQNQPTSCIAFETTFDRILGTDVMYQRKKHQTLECEVCVNSSAACTCQVEWEKTEVFKNLCESTEVDGAFGQVYWLDMTRNPGSTRTGRRLAQKTVVGLYQNCYASSCVIPQLQSMATRNWYKSDPDLAVAAVAMRKLGTPFGASAGEPAGGWPWFAYVLLSLVFAICVFGLVRLFMMPKKGAKPGRGRHSSDFSEADMSMNVKGDDRDFEQMQPLSMGDSQNWGGSNGMMEPLPTQPSGLDAAQMQMRAPSMQMQGMQMQQMPQQMPQMPQQMQQMPQMSGASRSMQGYQGSMQACGYNTGYAGTAGPSYASPLSSQVGGWPQELTAPNGNLMAQALQMSQQIEATGSQAVRSMTQGPLAIQPSSYSMSYAQQPVAYQQHLQQATPAYRPAGH